MALDPVAFIGLGTMGFPMASRLLDGHCQVTVHTRTRSKAEALIARGARWAATPAEAAANGITIFICVPDTPDVEAVLFGKHGVAVGAGRNSIIVDHSTISPTATREFARALSEKNLHLLDAPVSGGDVGAKNGTLSIMVGGDPKMFSHVRRHLEMMGKTITHVGPSGSGQLTKLTNNILVAITNLGVCEALTFAKSNGLDLEKTITAIGGGAAGSWQLSNLGPKMIAGDFKPGFMIKLQQKDLRLALEALGGGTAKLPALDLVHRLFARAIEDGRGDEGTQALISVVEGRAQ